MMFTEHRLRLRPVLVLVLVLVLSAWGHERVQPQLFGNQLHVRSRARKETLVRPLLDP